MKKLYILLSFILIQNSFAEGNGFLLGTGYNSKLGRFTGRCILPGKNDELIKGGDTSAVFTNETNLTREKLLAKLDLNMEGSVKITEISASVKGNFALSNESNEFRLNQVLEWKITGPSLQFVPQIKEDGFCATSDGLNSLLLKNGSKQIKNSFGCTSPELSDQSKANEYKIFIESCGDSYVSQVQLGGQLIVSVNFDFNDSYLLTAFEATGTLNLTDFFEGQAKFGAKYEKFKNKFSININALQIGGDVHKLSKILGAETTGNDRVAALKCAFNEEGLKKCSKAFSDIIDYARNNFSPSLANMNYDESKSSGPAIIGHTIKSYKLGGYSQLYGHDSGFIALELSNAKKDIIEKGLESISYSNRINKLLNLTSLSTSEREKLNFELLKNEKNFYGIKEVEALCFDGSKDNCINQYNFFFVDNRITLQNQKKIDFDLVENANGYLDLNIDNLKVSEDFLNICQLYSDSRSQRNSINTIIRMASAVNMLDEIILSYDKDSSNLKINADKCQILYNSLKEQLTLDLSKYRCLKDNNKNEKYSSICSQTSQMDLRPLKGLYSLSELYLESNNIFIIDPIIHLKDNLEAFYIGNNKVSDISKLSQMTNLKKIDVSNNNIRTKKHVIDSMPTDTMLKLLRMDSKSYSQYTDNTGYKDSNDILNTLKGKNNLTINKLLLEPETLENHCNAKYSSCLRDCADGTSSCGSNKELIRVYR